jgi:hypothetical protein
MRHVPHALNIAAVSTLRNSPATRKITNGRSPLPSEDNMKRSHAALLALLLPLLPLGLAAQQPTAPPANPVTTAFRGRIMANHRNLAQAFDSIPATMFGYKPTPAQQTVGYIAQHLANDNYFFCNNFGDLKANRPARHTETPDSVKATWPKDSLVAQLKESFNFCQQAFGQLDDAKLTRSPSPLAGTHVPPHARRWCLATRSTWPITTASSRTTCASTICSRPLRCRDRVLAATKEAHIVQ